MRIAARRRCGAGACYTMGWRVWDAVDGMVGVAWGRLLHSRYMRCCSRVDQSCIMRILSHIRCLLGLRDTVFGRFRTSGCDCGRPEMLTAD
jgi:hypothetical protein